MQINILEAKNRLSQLIQSALNGQKIVIANRGKPVVQLVPVGDEESNNTRPVKRLTTWLAENPLPTHLQRSHEEIEVGIQKERAGWD